MHFKARNPDQNEKWKTLIELTWEAAILNRALRILESVSSETLIWNLMSSPTVMGFFAAFAGLVSLPEGLFLEDGEYFKPNAFFTLLAAVDVSERWREGDIGGVGVGDDDDEERSAWEMEERGFPEEVRHAETKIS